jgi:pyruvate carboxylase
MPAYALSGPVFKHLHSLGDKVRAREIAEAAGVPVLGGTACGSD